MLLSLYVILIYIEIWVVSNIHSAVMFWIFFIIYGFIDTNFNGIIQQKFKISPEFFFMSNRFVISILICLAFLTVSCSPQENVNPGAAWDYSDLRILSEYDDLISEGDFIAGYSRLA